MPDDTDTLPAPDTTTETPKPWERFAKPADTGKPWERFAAPKEPAPLPKPAFDPIAQAQIQSGKLYGTTSPEKVSFEQYQTAHPLTPEQIAAQEHGEIRPLTGMERFKFEAQNVAEKLFPGYAEKGSASPVDVATSAAMLLPAGIPESLGKVMLAYYGAQTLKEQPEIVRQVSDAVKSGDYGTAKRIATGDILNLGILGASVAGMHAPTETLPPPVEGPLQTGARLRTPEGAVPPPEPQLGPFTAPGRGLPAPSLGDIRFPRAKPEVPGTPAEPRVSSVDEIRNAGARTIADIQKLFPKAELTREQARELRNTAWGKPEPPPPSALHKETETVLRPVQQPGVTEARTGEVPAPETGETTGTRSGTVPGTETREIPLEVPEPRPDQLTTPEEKFVGKTNPKAALSPRYFRDVGSAVNDPQWWVSLLRRMVKGDIFQQDTAYQIGAYLRQLGDKKATPVVDALWKARDQLYENGKVVREQLNQAKTPEERMKLLQSPDFVLLGSTQFPREAIEAAHNVGSAKNMVPESAGKPLTEKILSAAYKPTPEGKAEYGPHHPGILERLGVKGFETKESRNTPQFGYKTTAREFVERPEGAEVAKAGGQQTEPFDVDETGTEQPHSDEIKSATEPGKTVSEQKPEAATTVPRGTTPPATETPEQFNLFEAPREKPEPAQVIQLRRMLETAERLYGEYAQAPERQKAIATRLGELEQARLQQARGETPPAEPPPEVTAPTEPPEAPPEVTAPAEPDKPVQPDSPIPAAEPAVKTYNAVTSPIGEIGPRPTLKVQKQFLTAAVNKAIKELKPEKLSVAQTKLIKEGQEISAAIDRMRSSKYSRQKGDEALAKKANNWTERMKAHLPYVVFDVPGDGVFSVLKTADALTAFRDIVSGFPVGKGGLKAPSKGRTTPTPAPALVENPELPDITKAIASHASTDASREPLQKIYSNGKEVIASDGRRLVRVVHDGPGTLEKPVAIDPETGKVAPWDEKNPYPEYSQVVVPKEEQKFIGTADTESLWRDVVRAEMMTSERANSVKLYLNPDGTFGTASAAPELGESAHNIQKDAKLVGSFNPSYLRDALETARKLGNSKVDFYGKEYLDPLVIRGQNHEETLMPMRTDGEKGSVPTAKKGTTPFHSDELPPVTRSAWFGTRAAENVKGFNARIADLRKELKKSTDPSEQKYLRDRIKELQGQIKKLGPLPETEPAPTTTPPEGTKLGFGATSRPRPSAPSKVPPALQGVTQSASVQALHQSVVSGAKGVASVLTPTLIGKSAAESGRIVSRMAAERDLKIAQVDAAVEKARNQIDKLPRDQKYQFWQDWENGVLSKDPLIRAAQESIRKELDVAAKELIKRNLMRPDSLITDKEFLSRIFVKGGEAADIIAQAASRRPLRGDRGYLKQRTFEWFMDAIKAGMQPLDDNVFYVQQERLRSMWKNISSHDGIERENDAGRLRFKRVFEEMPEGYRAVDDSAFKVFGPPTQVLNEWVDKHVFEGLQNVMRKLGITHERKYSTGMRGALGYSVVGKPYIRTRFGTETSVIAHELGHQLDYKYDLWNRIHKEAIRYGKKYQVTQTGSQAQRALIDKELRDIADKMVGGRGAKGYTHKKEEKIAQMLEAYIHAPQQMQEVAPNVWGWLDNFLKTTPELKALSEIRPGIELTKLSSEKATGGLLQYGEYVLPEDSARIWNNFVSHGLQKWGFFRGLRSAGNFMLSSRLIGGFHIGFVALETPIGMSSLAMWHAFNGNLGKAATTALRVPIAPASYFIEGAKIKNILEHPDGSKGYDLLREWLVRAGGGVGTDPVWKFEAARSMRKSFLNSSQDFRDGKIAKGFVEAAFGTAKTYPALVDKIMGPIFNTLVPNVKLGAWSRLVSDRIEAAGGWDKLNAVQQDKILTESWNSVDNRFGLLRYANLHWNPYFKDATQLAVQSVGWNLGYREFIGAGADVGKTLADFARGRGWTPTERTMYPLAVAIVTGAIGGTITWLLTGHPPKSYMDYMHPDTGQKDQRGQEIRLNLPTYWKDLEHWRKDPVGTAVGKLHPLGSTVGELYRNRDWYGVQIYPPYGSESEKVKDILGFMAKSFEPYTIENIDRLRQRGLSWPLTAGSIIGVTPVPRSVEQSTAEEALSRIVESKQPVGGYTQEQEKAMVKRREAITDIQKGTMTPAQAAQQGLLPRREIRHYARASQQNFLQNNIARADVTIPEAVSVWDRATPEEKKSIFNVLRHRIIVTTSLTSDEKRFLLRKLNTDITPAKAAQ